MKFLMIVSIFVLFTVGTFAANSCGNRGDRCTESIQCRSRYCRGEECVNYGDDRINDKGPNPCWSVSCRTGYTCVLEAVVCIRAPCKPIPQCVRYH